VSHAVAATAAPRKKDWVSITFLTLTPVIGILGTALYTWQVGFEWWMLGLCVTLYALVGMSICAGYHRYFSHKTYECAWPVQLFYAVFGASAVQNSIAAWSAGHRRHHQHIDDDWDPYNIKRGFWWAHILWIFYKDPTDKARRNVPDLMKNPIVRWQDRYYIPLLVAGSVGLPALVGWYFGDVVAGILWGGFLRIVITHHSTFFVNSLAHHMGDRTYDPHVSACDNWAVALLTLGEGYHSFHHRFPADYRNGIRWYHWDPAKWFIHALTFVGLAGKLRRTPDDRIEEARMKSALALSQLHERLESAPRPLAEQAQGRLQAAREALERAIELRTREMQANGAGPRDRVREARKAAELELRDARRHWQEAIRMLQSVPVAAAA
jgi:stearoyl-CoA desaturase (delta-9 desaturase)